MERRYDLDWLRVILFGILVPYHALVGFVSYGQDVYGYRNQDVGGDLAEFTIFFLHGWRLPALFLISGVGTWFLMRRRGARQFLKNRSVRLLIPLVFGAVLWNSVIGYYQLLAAGQDWGFVDFFVERLKTRTPWKIGHLWFLVNLFLYSVASLPLMFWLLSGQRRWFGWLLLAVLLIVPIILKPGGSTLIGVRWTFVTYWAFYLAGFWAMTLPRSSWYSLERFRWIWLALGIGTIAVLGEIIGALAPDPDRMNLVIQGGWQAKGWPFASVLTLGYGTLYAINSALWCAAIFAFAHRFLNRTSAWLPTLNRVVYPFYIFHFVVLMVILFYLRQIGWPWFVEFLILTLGTFSGTALIVWAFDKSGPLGIIVGFSAKRRAN